VRAKENSLPPTKELGKAKKEKPKKKKRSDSGSRKEKKINKEVEAYLKEGMLYRNDAMILGITTQNQNRSRDRSASNSHNFIFKGLDSANSSLIMDDEVPYIRRAPDVKHFDILNEINEPQLQSHYRRASSIANKGGLRSVSLNNKYDLPQKSLP
jgi:hypothetical protein